MVSYGLWKWLANSPPIYRTVLGTVLEQFSGKQSSPFMELLVQLCLTNCVTASYGLWKWLASSSPIYGNGFKSGTSENQRLHKKLGNSEIRLHTDLGNSELKKLNLNKNWWNCDRNLRQSAPIGKKIEAELCE